MIGNAFKTIIIGAGPAGLTAGRYLEDALILEQKEEIGRPVQCAEGLSKKILEREGILPNPEWICAVINETQIILPNGKIIRLPGKEQGYILDRVGFEKFLASQCQASLQLQNRVIDIKRENNFWKLRTEKGESFKSKYLIGADGPFSIVRKKIFKEKLEMLPCIEYLVKLEKEIENSVMKMYFDKERFPSGYAWLFPKSKNTANIGLGGKENLQEKFKDFLKNTIKKDFGNFELLENKSGVVPWGGAKIKLFKDNAFLVGDAGGLVDPIFGGGIGNAMISGRMAAELILSGKAEIYDSKIKSIPFFSKDLLLAQEILYSFDNKVLNEIGEVLEKRKGDIFYLKNSFPLPAFLLKPNLRKNILKFLKLLFIYQKYAGQFSY